MELRKLLDVIHDCSIAAERAAIKGMSQQDWIDAWKEDPHWGESKTPSPLAKELIKLLDDKSTILEIGCGNGRDSIYFGRFGHDVIGIDISPDAIKIAKSNNTKTNVKFEIGDVEKLKYQDSFFDAVYSLSVLHSTNLKKSVKEISRVLKTNGKSILYLYDKTKFENEDIADEQYFKIGDLEELFKINNLRIVDKWKDNLKDKDDDGTHIHNIVVYSLMRDANE